jgi:hypothetical protein
MPTQWQLDCLQARFHSLEAEIIRVQAKYHPYTEPDIIFSALLLALRSDLEDLQTSCRLLAAKPQYLHKVFEDVVARVQNVFLTLDLAERVDSSRIPFELLRSLSWAAGDLLHEQCKTVVRLHTAYNYTVTSCRRWFSEHSWDRHWTKQVAARTGETVPMTVLVLGFPSPDVTSTLLHVIAAHELGHEVLWNHRDAFGAIQGELLEQAKAHNRELLEEFIIDNTHRRHGVSQQDAYDESSKLMDAELLSISGYWLTEIWADLVAARLVGPASLAGLDRIALEPSAPRQTHPPGNLRRLLIKTYLERYFPHIASDDVWSSVLTTSPTASAPQTRSPLTPLFVAVESLCTHSLDLLAPLLENIPSPLSSPEITSKVVPAMEECIDHLCPPNHALPASIANTSASVWLIMYGIWHYRMNVSRFHAFCEALEPAADNSAGVGEGILGNLLLHGLQSAELLARWHRKRAATGSSVGS